MDRLCEQTSTLIDIAYNSSEEQIKAITDSLEIILLNQSLYRIIKRAKDYYPTGGHIHNSEGRWLEGNVVEFKTSGWQTHVLKYQYRDGLYNKINESHWNINGRGTPIYQYFDDDIWITEDQVLKEINTVLSE